MKVRLHKIHSVHNNLRTNVITGATDALPTVGEDFIMTAPPLDTTAGVRYIRTTPVLSVSEDNGILFSTCNSTYRLELL